MKYLLPLLILLLLTGCSESAKVEDTASEETSTYDDIEVAEEAATAEEAPTYSGQSFDGNPCIGDCSGHEAGYQWAEENGITDPDNCSTPSNSFNEGCQSYVEEQ